MNERYKFWQCSYRGYDRSSNCSVAVEGSDYDSPMPCSREYDIHDEQMHVVVEPEVLPPRSAVKRRTDEYSSAEPKRLCRFAPFAPRVVLVASNEECRLADKLSCHPNRSSVFYQLLLAYRSFWKEKITFIPPESASAADLLLFHSADYVEALRSAHARSEDGLLDLAEFGLCDDCAPFEEVWNYSTLIAGGSIVAAKKLMNDSCDIAVHWDGGRHHAHRDSAAGFCFVNDVVLSIVFLLKKFTRVLYVDIDIHHCDGVEEAFFFSDKVFCLSFHHKKPGFFPGTGCASRTGAGPGRAKTLNVPLAEFTSDETFGRVFEAVASMVCSTFEPDVIVLECGADGLAGDRLGCWNLTTNAYVRAATLVRSWRRPLLVLGGGGYNLPNTARCWTAVTAALAGAALPDQIPDHSCFALYGPSFSLSVEEMLREDANAEADVAENLQSVQSALMPNMS